MIGISKLYLYGGIALAVSIVLGSTFIWYNSKLNAAYEQGQADMRVIAQEMASTSFSEQIKENAEEIVALRSKVREEKRKVRELERMLLVEHELDRLLQAKPGLILDRVNKGSAKALKDIEEASGETSSNTNDAP